MTNLTRRAALSGLSASALLAGAAQADDVTALTWDLFASDDATFDRALAALRARGDLDVAAAMILAMRFRRFRGGPLQQALQAMAGEPGRFGWFDWMLWQEANPGIRPHPSYGPILLALLERIDPAFRRFLNPDHLDGSLIRVEEITWGGVAVDGIPSLDHPRLVTPGEARYLRGEDLVFGVEIEGDQRAYPLRIMNWHEMFNEVIGGVPVALAYCTLCGAGILFETRVPGRSEPFVFGSSGLLYRSNKLMFDRATDTLWNQFTGRPVAGPLAGSGIALRQRPVTIAPWSEWLAANPETKVLSIETGHDRDYGPGVAYEVYFDSPELMFPALTRPGPLAKKDYVFGIRGFGAAKAWPLEAFDGGRVLNDRVGDLAVVLIGDAAGRTVRAYERGGRVFARAADGGLTDQAGAPWQRGEAALRGPDGAALRRVAGHVAYWFAWDGYLGAASGLSDLRD